MMSKASILAVTAVAAIALAIPAMFSTSIPAMAGSSYSSSTASSTPPSSTPPGDPGNPGGPGGPGGGGNGGDLPPLSDDEKIAQLTETCNAALSTLIKIPASMVSGFDGSVKVVPVCNSGLGHKVPVDNSQAAPLEAALAGNSVLTGPLAKNGFKPGDVVGIVLMNGEAILYVHTYIA